MFIRYQIERTSDNQFEIRNAGAVSAIHFQYRGKQIYPDDFIRHSEKILKNLNFDRHQNIILFGARNCILIEEIIERMSNFSTLIVIEPLQESEIFEVVGTEAYGRMFLDPRCKIIVGDVDFVYGEMNGIFANAMFNYNMRNIEILTLPYLKALYPGDIQNMIGFLFEKLYAIASGYGNSVEDILWGLDNLFNNWDIYCQGIPSQQFAGIFRDVPAIVVGAGPSLDRCIEKLKMIQHHALIFAVDAAVNTLRKHGIRIDAISTIERTIVPIRFYKEIEKFEDEIFIGPNVIRKEIMEKFSKWIFTGRMGDGFFREITSAIGNESIDVGITVANVPFAYARAMGCNPIVFTGVDLAYEGEVTHTSDIVDSMTDDIRQDYIDNMTKVKSIHGKMLDSYEYFVHTKVWFERRIAADKATRFINTTDFGALILGMENMSMDRLAMEIADIPLDKKLIDYYRENALDAQYAQEITDKAIAFNERVMKNLERLIEKAESSLKRIEQNQDSLIDTILDNRTEIDLVFFEDVALRFLFQPVFIGYYRDLHSFPIKLDKDALEGLEKRSLHYYDTIMRVGRTVEDSLKAYNELLGIYKEKFIQKERV